MRFLHKLLLAASFAAVPLAVGPACAQYPTSKTAPPPAPVHFTDEQKADLRRISAYLSGLKSVEGHFLQIGPDGKSEQGTFYLKKPGRMRFEYQKPNPNLIISDGATIAVENSDLKTTDRYPLLNSPLSLLLNDSADLAADRRVVSLVKEPGALSVTARETQGPAEGQIKLVFADSGAAGLELRQWDVVDAQGMRTTVIVNDLHQVADIPARLFVIEDLSPFKKKTN